MSSPQRDIDLEPTSESAHREIAESSPNGEREQQADSPKDNKNNNIPTASNLPAETPSEVQNKAETLGHGEAEALGTEDQNVEKLDRAQTPSSITGALQTSQMDRQELPGEFSHTGFTQTPQTPSLPETIQEDIGDDSNALAPVEEDDFMEINAPVREVIDLTGNDTCRVPSLALVDHVVKQESDDTMVPAELVIIPEQSQIDEADSVIDTDPMDVDEVPENVNALPVMKGGDDSWQISPEDRADETENAMLVINAAAHNFRSSLSSKPYPSRDPAPAIDDFEGSGQPDIDSKAENAIAILEFEEMKREYLRKQKAGKLDVEDDIEFNRAQEAEFERQHRRARNNAYHTSPRLDDQSMFFSDDGQRSASPVPEKLNEVYDFLTGYESPEPAQASPTGKPDKKVRGRPKGSKSIAKGGIKKPAGKPSRAKLGKDGKKLMSNFVNVGSLLNNDLIAIAQENQKRESQPTFTSKSKDKALTELISSMPKEQQRLHGIDKKELLLATKKFAGRGLMRSDGAGGWKLRGMKSSLHHYQLLGTAFMRDLENRPNKPFGGFVSDDMGLGKTVMAICNILDGRPNILSKAKATLVVAPSSLLTQWMAEIDKHAEGGKLGRVMMFRSGSRLVANDMEAALSIEGVVITSYHEVLRSFPKNDPPLHLYTEKAKEEWWAKERETRIGPYVNSESFALFTLTTGPGFIVFSGDVLYLTRRKPSKLPVTHQRSTIQNRLEEFYAFFRFLDLPHTGSYETFKTNFCKRGSELSIKRLRQYLDQFMLRRSHSDQLFGRPILKLKALTSKTVMVEFNTIEKTIYKVVRERFVQRLKLIVRQGSIEKKYQNIFTLLLRLRQLTCHCFLVQNTFKDLLEEADLQRLWKLTEDESDPSNQSMIQGLKATLGNATADTSIPSTKTATAGPITSRFRKYLQSMRDDGKWAEIIDKTMCNACKEPPTEPHITGCNHIYCYACLNQLSWHAAMDGDKQGSQCLECGAHFDRTEPCSREDLMTPEREAPVSVRSGVRKGATVDAEGSTDWLTVCGPIFQSAKSRATTLQIEQWRQEDPDAKIIVFTQFQEMIKVMKRICEERQWGCTPFHGSMAFEARDKAVKSFTNDPKCFVMLCGLKAGGVGLNLTAANRVIIIDLWWNQFVETQAFCRVYRIGQDRDVEMVRFVAKDSVDEDIISMQERKNEEIDQAIDSKHRPGRLTAKELLQLFATDLERDKKGEPIAGPNEEPFILTDDPYHESSYIDDNSD